MRRIGDQHLGDPGDLGCGLGRARAIGARHQHRDVAADLNGRVGRQPDADAGELGRVREVEVVAPAHVME